MEYNIYNKLTKKEGISLKSMLWVYDISFQVYFIEKAKKESEQITFNYHKNY